MSDPDAEWLALLPAFQVRFIASSDVRTRAWLAGESRTDYIITRQFFSPAAMRWVTEPLSY